MCCKSLYLCLLFVFCFPLFSLSNSRPRYRKVSPKDWLSSFHAEFVIDDTSNERLHLYGNSFYRMA